MQLGVEHQEAAAHARSQGMEVVMNRCPKIEYARLFGELGLHGFNSGVRANTNTNTSSSTNTKGYKINF